MLTVSMSLGQMVVQFANILLTLFCWELAILISLIVWGILLYVLFSEKIQ